MNPYAMRPTRVAYVEVLGKIWMPATTAAHTYELTDYDLTNIGDTFTRENVEQWLATHAGDFQSITDFHAVCGEDDIPWKSEESENAYNDAVLSPE